MSTLSRNLSDLARAAAMMARQTADPHTAAWLHTLRAELLSNAASVDQLEAHMVPEAAKVDQRTPVVIPAAHRFRPDVVALPHPWGPGSAA